MKLSAPVFQLKRRAKLMARNDDIPLNEALDRIAREEGFSRWSLLSAQLSAGSLSQTLLSRLGDGELLLIAGRPGQGKTMLGIQLLLEATLKGRRAVFFTLEFTQQQARRHIRSLAGGAEDAGNMVEIVTSEEISAEYIIRHMAGAPKGSVAVIDYLQILDQQRNKPELSEQVRALGVFAGKTGVAFAFLSQVDRTFDPDSKRLPDIGDIRLPNLVDLGLFSKACFLHGGEAQFQDVA